MLVLLSGCSLTSHLPQGEVLYTGVSRIEHHRVDTVDRSVDEAVALALEVQPNSALLGSAYHMSPFPVGLWLYNGLYTDREKGFRHWLWTHFKSDPTLVSQVNPELRSRAAEAALKDEGYFDASVNYSLVPDPKDSLKARIAYDVTYQHQSRLGKITIIPSRNARVDSIIAHTMSGTLLHRGDRFSAANLEAERTRIVRVLQDSGYYFFKPEYIRLMGDSTLAPNTVDLRVLVGAGADSRAMSPCTIDSVHYHLDYGAGLRTQNADTLRFLTVGYNGPRQIKTQYLRRALGFRRHALCTPERLDLVKTLNARLNTFKYTTSSLQVLRLASDSLPDDTTSLRLVIDATYNMPWQGTTEIGGVYKDNQQIGPGVTSTIMRRNLWGGGERLTMQLTGSYEWSVNGKEASGDLLPNSFELGTKVSVSVPRLQLPKLFRPDRERPVSSTYSISVDWLRRAGLFEMVKAGGQIEYGFSINKWNSFSFTPLKISYVSTLRRSDDFQAKLDEYESLQNSFENQFIPQIQASWTYEKGLRYANVTLAEAGGLTDVLMGQFGSHRTQGERQLFFQPFSQFIKATAELRNRYPLSRQVTLATRLLGGVGYAYGNSTTLPYSEQFYVGGPNSLRGFRVRGVGPGSVQFYSFFPSKYNYLDRVGDIKLEGNMELRFPIVGSFHGAIFVDAGNVWRMRETDLSPFYAIYSKEDLDAIRNLPLDEISDEQLGALWVEAVAKIYKRGENIDRSFLKQLAVDCGVGLRLDLGMLVMRLDVGLPLHDPGEVVETGYFNCTNGMLKKLEWNIAVGYPF